MKHADPPRTKHRYRVELETARSGWRPYVVTAVDEHGAIAAACERVAEDDQGWHVLSAGGVRKLGAA